MRLNLFLYAKTKKELILRKLILFSWLILSACTTKVSTLHQDVDVLKNTDYGYLLMSIDTNQSLYQLDIYGDKSLYLTYSDLRAGSNYLLVQIPAGQYYLGKIKLSRNYYFTLEKEDWQFHIEPNVISYIGEFSMETRGYFSNSANLKMLNKSSYALEFMEKEFPSILANREIHYNGAGEDDFLLKMTRQIKSAQIQ